MQVFKPLTQDHATIVGWGASVVLVTEADKAGPTSARLSGLGAQVHVQPQLYDALSVLIDDPRDADMLVIDCDAYGGLEMGRRAFAILAEAGLRLPVILISQDCGEQSFPNGREAPFVLRAPVSAVALRVAFESAFYGRKQRTS